MEGRSAEIPLASSADLGGGAPAAWCARALRARVGGCGPSGLRSCRVLEPGAPSFKCRRSKIISGPLSQVFANLLVSCCKGNTLASPSTHPHALSQPGASWLFGAGFLGPSTSFPPPSAYVRVTQHPESFSIPPPPGTYKESIRTGTKRLFGHVL